ncbi:hypothetical protein GCM10009114_30210 [Aliiglaciecola litoralis]|uniref:Peptidase S8/S53 domain-containing protein n=2 Tax=Aliiglaciecola litoralis TaxID=582857 RepID=A0ABN1LQF8_9ALTE
MWDQDANRIDDRIEAVNNFGLNQAFENNDLINGRLRFAVFSGDVTEFGVYVGFENIPTETDLDQLRQSGVNVEGMKAYQTIPYVRMTLNYQDIQTVSNLPGVTRVESIPMMYAKNNNANKASGAVASGYKRFPTVHENLGITGRHVVVGILDTGVNDAPDMVTSFPGHESFAGKFIAGGDFYSGQALLNTGTDSSINPIDRGENASSNHGTHVAGTTLGTGGNSGVFGGVAPGALLVDAKVLSDGGLGFGSADGVEWAIVNKDEYGIKVLNLSLGGLDSSDGSDAGSQTINAAYDAGIISVIAAGNDGETNYISSPAAADKGITVGAIADYNTIDRADDTIADFSNEGPRTDDGDTDNIDEMKPEIAAPGSGLISADGTLTSDGRQYKSLSGTSMATPHVAGVIALMLEANPNLTPADIDATLRHTAEHRYDWGKVDASQRPFAEIDPNYHPSGGWGQVDAYAAVKEALYLAGDTDSQTQVVHISATPDEANNSITLNWKSQRETNLSGYDVYRATDVGGAPGVFTKINTSLIAGTGTAEIAKVNNRNHYSITDTNLTVGETYWYRIDHSSIDGGVVEEPAYPVSLGTPRAIAYLEYSITHDAISNDLLILLGSGAEPGHAKFIVDGASPQEAIATSTEEGNATTGTQRYDFRIALTSLDGVDDMLPPSKTNPWWLTVKEGGYVNRNGRLNDLRLIMLDENGDETAVYQTADTTPQQTVEGSTSTLWIPDDPSVVAPGDAPTLIELSPSVGKQNEVITLDIYGAEMLPGSTIEVSGVGVVASNVTYVSGSRLSAQFAIASDAEVGSHNVTVTNPDGQTYTLNNGFTVFDPSGNNGGGNNGEIEVTRIDDSDPAIEYHKKWHRKGSESASNDGFHRGKGKKNGDTRLKLAFTGSQISMIYGTAEKGGDAEIYIDGVRQQDLSFDGDAKQNHPDFNNQVTYGELSEGEHTFELVMIENFGYIDGFEVVSEKETAATDSSSAEYRSQTSDYSPAGQATAMILPVAVGENVTHISIEVEDLASASVIQLMDSQGTIVAESVTDVISGDTLLDTPVTQGNYQFVIANPAALMNNIDISIARTYLVK